MPRKPKLIFFIPLVGIFSGAMASYFHQISPVSFLPNILGLVIGFALLFFLKTQNFRKGLGYYTFGAIAFMAASLCFQGMDSVRRWISIGPLQINAGMIALPIVLYGIADIKSRILPLLLICLVSLIHFLQPDFGQAVSFNLAAALLLLLIPEISLLQKVFGILICGISTFFTMGQPDTLEALPQVEGILHLMPFSISILNVLLLIAPFVWLTLKSPIKKERILSAAFGVYLLAEFIVTKIGSFPVPVIGAGASPVISYILLLGLILKSNRKVESPQS